MRAIDELVKYVDQYMMQKYLVSKEDLHIGYYLFLVSVNEVGFDYQYAVYDTSEYNIIQEMIINSGFIDEYFLESQIADHESVILFDSITYVGTTLGFNPNGAYYNCLYNIESKDSILINYLEVLDLAAFVSPGLLASGLLHNRKEFDFKNRLTQVIIAIEYFM
jgi:hypothetical protein